MKNTPIRALTLVLVAGLVVPASEGLACSAFLAAHDDVVLFGNNEDYMNPATKMWFVLGDEDTHGRVYFGFDDMTTQGGMNEAGLAFDGFATRPKPVTGSLDKEVYAGSLIDKAMAECSTVEEVLALFRRYNLRAMAAYMLMFADRTGDSVIIEGDEFIRKSGAFQVVTNFYQSEDPRGKNAYGQGVACQRFDLANEMLGDIHHLSVEKARDVLAAVHVEDGVRTLYSNVYDLKQGRIHLYHFYDFENEVVVDLARELRKGPHVVDLHTLFPANEAYQRFLQEKHRELEQRRGRRATAAVGTEVLARYAGSYECPAWPAVISVEEEHLVARVGRMAPLELTPSSDTDFFHVGLGRDWDLAFDVGKTGRVDGLDVRTGGLEASCPRGP